MTTQPLRYFRNHYLCEECPNEFSDEMCTISHSWCPACDGRCEPYSSESLVEEVEADDEEEVA